jgi:hypothetical protein
MAHHWRVDAWGNHDGAAGDLLGTVLYWPLGLEFTDMNSYDIGSYTFTEQSSKIFLMAPPPTSVGGYRMGEIIFNLTKKPLWIHRMGVRLVLGWKWVDA